jgi:hypothetical protein
VRILYVIFAVCLPLKALTIKIDYRFDSKGFFNDPQAKTALEAAAARWSRVIDQSLLPVNLKDEEQKDCRFKLIHPSTGEIYEVSAAASEATDFLLRYGQPPADEYLGGYTLEEDEWVLFVGARPLTSAARAGPLASGINTVETFDDPKSFLNRGFNVGRGSLTVLGGSISFCIGDSWNFDLSNPGGLDFYSIALHEIGHCLGFSANLSDEWKGLVKSARYIGPKALAAYEADTGEAVTFLELVSSSNNHWRNNIYQSKIFPLGSPDYRGTVGRGYLQDLLMDPSLGFALGLRSEISNVDVAAIQDIGWSVITKDPPPLVVLLGVSRKDDGSLVLEIPSEEAAIYTIQTSTDGTNWQDVIPSITGTGKDLSWKDGEEGFYDPNAPAAELSAKFYRVCKK